MHTFSYKIEEIDKSIDFDVSFVNSGISNYEFWGCLDNETLLEIDEITYSKKGLSAAEIELIDSLIEDGDLDDEAWNTLE